LLEANTDLIREGTFVRLITGDADNPNTVARTKELHEKLESLKVPNKLIVVPGIKHAYKLLYDEIGDPAFAYYFKIFGEGLTGEGV
jgi:hypothetical protein